MIVVKIGGSAITDKRGVEKPKKGAISAIAGVIAESARNTGEKLILVHGAGSFGHPQVIKYGIKDGVMTRRQEVGFAKTHASVLKLSYMLAGALEKNGMKISIVSPLHFVLQKNKRIQGFDESGIELALKRNFTPLLHGDVVIDSAIGGSICSGDAVVSHLGRKAKRVIFITEVNGVLDAKGKTIRIVRKKDLKGISFGKTRGHDVTGGMREKLNEIMKIGKPCFVIGAGNLKGIGNLVLGKKEGGCTRVES